MDTDKIKQHLNEIRVHADEAEKLLNGNPPPPPPPNGKEIKSLEVQGSNILVNGKPFKGIGVSRREILLRAIGIWHSLYDKPLEWFMDLSVEYGLTFERIDACSNYDLLYDYCEDRRKNGIVVEVTLMQNVDGKPIDMGEPKKVIEKLAPLVNVIFDPVNEFSTDDPLNDAWWHCNYLMNKGLIAAAGNFGTGTESLSKRFNPVSSNNQIINVHRHWDKATIEEYRRLSNKPIIRDEFFRITTTRMKQIAEESFDAGACMVNYYGLRDKGLFPDLQTQDPDPWREYFEVMGSLAS